MAELLASPAFWGSLATLTFLEIVLGIDNLLFISIATGKLEGKQRQQAQRIGIWGAMALRILMLGLIFWIIQLDRHALFHVPPDVALMVAGGDRLAAGTGDADRRVGRNVPADRDAGPDLLDPAG